jgi:hypothetical protein
MKRTAACVLTLSLLASLATYTFVAGEKNAVAAENAPSAEKQLGHMVFFTLKDRTPEAQKKLVALCQKYLGEHPGTVYFSVGAMAPEMDRDVNDRDFDVALHLIFKNKKAQDDYQVAPRHLSFVEEGKPMWAKVRVFDSYIQ